MLTGSMFIDFKKAFDTVFYAIRLCAFEHMYFSPKSLFENSIKRPNMKNIEQLVLVCI